MPWSTLTGGCCSPSVRRASRWRGYGSFPAARSSPARRQGALIRELKEELDIDVAAKCLAPLSFASHSYPEFHLLMPLFVCRRWEGDIAPQQGQQLAWVRAQKLADYAMPPADEPLKVVLRDLL